MRTIREILSRKSSSEVISIDIGATVLDAVKKMDDANLGSVVILDQGKLAGIFTERDLMRRVVLQGKLAPQTPVRDVMTSNIIVTKADTRSGDAMSMMTQHRCRHLPVLDGNELLGVVSVGDLMKDVSDEKSVELNFLKDYIST